MKNARGFTLIEVIISITILASLMVLAARTFQSALDSKKKIQVNLDHDSAVRDALKIIETDINRAFHYLDLEQEIAAVVKKGGTSTAPPPTGGQPPPPPPPAAPPTPEEMEAVQHRVDPRTFFIGQSEKIDFVTLSQGRMIVNSRQADFIEVAYFLESCQNQATGKSSSCLYRRTQSIVGPTPKEIDGRKYVLLENVSEFKLQYMGQGKQDWVTQWRSDEAGDADTKDRFPDAVEVSLSITPDPNNTKRKISTQIIVPIRFPNNPEQKQTP